MRPCATSSGTGTTERPDKPIWIRLWPADTDEDGKPRGLRLQIDDEARQVEIEQMKSRDLDDIRPGGLGVHIIREVMDEVVYSKRETKGMRLTMVKHAPGAPGAAAGVHERAGGATQGEAGE